MAAHLPMLVKETFTISVAYFDPVTITVLGTGVYPRLLANLPRLKDEDWLKYIKFAERSLEKQRLQREKDEAEMDEKVNSIAAVRFALRFASLTVTAHRCVMRIALTRCRTPVSLRAREFRPLAQHARSRP